MRSVYLEGSEGEERQLPKRQTAMWRTETTLFPLLPSCFSTRALEQLMARSGDMPVYLENMSSGPSICTPTHLYKTLRFYPHYLSLFQTAFLLLATIQRTKRCGCSARSLLLAICHSKRHFQLVLDCFCCRNGSVACCDFLHGKLDICLTVHHLCRKIM